MRVVKPLVIVEDDLDMLMPNGLTLAQHMAKKIEYAARKCYKSEGRMTDESYQTFLKGLFQARRHTGIAEHRTISVTFITDRGVSHEGVRHRMAAYLQESTRYCDYADPGKASKGVTYILPPWLQPHEVELDLRESWNFVLGDDPFGFWLHSMALNESQYLEARKKWRPEQARGGLAHFVKTEYFASLNLGSWWNFLTKRTAPEAHPQMRQLAIPLLRYLQQRLPMFFDSIPMPNCMMHNPTFSEGTHGYVTGCSHYTFWHKDQQYEEAELVVHPFYDEVPMREVWSDA